MITHRSKIIISYLLTIIIAAGAGLWVITRFVRLGNVEFTDNATVEQQIVPVNSRVRGYIARICFDDFQPVKKGDTLVIIDDREMRLDVARARAEYESALAGRDVTNRSVGVASANVAVTDASIAEAKAVMELAAADLERHRKLMEQDAVTLRQFDAARTDYEAKKARYEMMSRQQSASSSVVEETRRRVGQSEAAVDLARALLETAELNLTYCVIVAPCDGYASRKKIQTGLLVQPGQTLLDVVDSNDVWVMANFKETQLKHIAPGSEARIEVDAIPGVTFKGTVQSISTATGAALSLLPQDNSAGNFVKVRQRIPVKIRFAPENPADDMRKLRAGMNVECEIAY